MSFSLAFTVANAEAGERLDVVVTEHAVESHPRGKGVSRSQVQRWIASGSVLVNGEPGKKSYPVEPQDRISVEAGEPEGASDGGGADSPELEPIDLEVIYRDEHMAAVNKPRGLAVHHAPGSSLPALVHHLPEHFPELREFGADRRKGLVHRLDKETSGVLLVAFDAQTLRLLSGQFKRREVSKRYRAICFSTPGRMEGGVEFPMGRSERDRRRMTRREDGKRSMSRYRLVRRWEQHFCELDFFPETGRTHQIRVHAEHLDVPLVGDTKYGHRRNSGLYDFLETPEEPGAPGYLKQLREHDGFESWRGLFLDDPGHLLHAAELTVVHPWQEERMTFSADPPRVYPATAELFSRAFTESRSVSN